MDTAEVRRVAALSRLQLSEEELAVIGRQLSAVLEYVMLLDEVETAGVEPMSHAIDLENVFRDDCCTASLPVSEALSNAPKTDGGYFLVPGILEQKTGG